MKYNYITIGQTKYHVANLRDRFLTVDHATTVKETLRQDPDWTVISSWAWTPCQVLLWIGCKMMRCELPDISPEIAKAYSSHGARKVIIEGGGNQKGLVQIARRQKLENGTLMNVIEFNPSIGDKLSRSQDAQDMMRAGRILMPQNDSDFPTHEVRSQLIAFSGNPKVDAHDDIVDTLSMAALHKAGANVGPSRVIQSVLVPAR